MQIPELNLFWLFIGAFVAAGATWWLDAVLIKRRANDTDSAALAALHEKARQVEPLNQKLRDAAGQIEELESRLLAEDTSSHVEELKAKTVELGTKLDEALRAEEEASRLAQTIKGELASKDSEILNLSSGLAEARQLIEQFNANEASYREQSVETASLQQNLADLKQRFEELQSTAPSDAELSNLRLRAEHSEVEVERLRGELEGSVPAARVEELEAQIQVLQEQGNAAVVSATTEFENERDGLLASISKLQSQLIESDEVVENFRSQLSMAHTALEAQASEPERIQSLEAALAERSAEVDRYSRRIPELEALIVDLRHDSETKSAAIEHLQSNTEVNDLRSTIASLTTELESLRETAHRDQAQLVQARAEAELLREAKPQPASTPDVATLEERMNDLFGAVQASHREAAENRRALQSAMEEIRQLKQTVGQPTSASKPTKPKAAPRNKAAGGGSVRAELIESSDLGELA